MRRVSTASPRHTSRPNIRYVNGPGVCGPGVCSRHGECVVAHVVVLATQLGAGEHEYPGPPPPRAELLHHPPRHAALVRRRRERRGRPGHARLHARPQRGVQRCTARQPSEQPPLSHLQEPRRLLLASSAASDRLRLRRRRAASLAAYLAASLAASLAAARITPPLGPHHTASLHRHAAAGAARRGGAPGECAREDVRIDAQPAGRDAAEHELGLGPGLGFG